MKLLNATGQGTDPDLGEKTFASPAISQGQIFLRGDKHSLLHRSARVFRQLAGDAVRVLDKVVSGKEQTELAERFTVPGGGAEACPNSCLVGPL